MFQNILHILMVLAIANPMCCCTMDGLAMLNQASRDAEPMHCCGTSDTGAAETESAPSDHNPEECPHQAQIDYPRAAQADMKSAEWNADFPVILYVLLHSEATFPSALAGRQITPLTASTEGQAVSYAQLYCVYRI